MLGNALCKEFNFMDKKEIIALIKKVGQEQNGCINSDGEYIDFCKGDEEYIFDNEDVNELAEKLIKSFSLHVVVKSFFCNNERSKDGKCFEQCGVCSEYASR